MHYVRPGFAIVGLTLCIGAAGQPVSGQPAQWKQSIERPSRSWDYDGKRILGHIGYDVCLWDATTGKLLRKMKGHKERIFAVQFSPDGHHALSSSWMGPGPMVMYKSKDTSTILWNLATGRDRDIFKGQVAGEFSPDGRRIVTFSQRPDTVTTTYQYTNSETGEVREHKSTVPVTRFDNAAVWDTFTGRQLVKAKLGKYSHPDSDTLHFSPDGRSFVHFASGAFLPYNSSGAVLFNTSDGRETGSVSRDDVKHGGHRYTSGGALATFDSQRARLIDLKSGQTLQSVEHGLKKGIWGAVWTHDGGKVVAIPYGGGAIKICDMESGKITTGAENTPRPYRAITSPDNSRLAIQSIGDKLELGIYDMNTGEEIARIKLAKSGHILGFSPDGKTLLVGGSQYSEYNSENEKMTLRPEFVIYDSENGKQIRTLNLLDEVNSDERNE